jgi:hypothetical protein
MSAGKIFKHYKGNYYRVLNIAQHTETSEMMVVYEQLYTNQYPFGYVWTRPFSMFNEEVTYNDEFVNRFEQVENYQ